MQISLAVDLSGTFSVVKGPVDPKVATLDLLPVCI